MTQRMHIARVQFHNPKQNLGLLIQSAYDDDFVMPDGSWRLVDHEKQIVEFGIILDDKPIDYELDCLKRGLIRNIGTNWDMLSVSDEIDHFDLDPCFA
jgi:hypothetical protein